MCRVTGRYSWRMPLYLGCGKMTRCVWRVRLRVALHMGGRVRHWVGWVWSVQVSADPCWAHADVPLDVAPCDWLGDAPVGQGVVVTPEAGRVAVRARWRARARVHMRSRMQARARVHTGARTRARARVTHSICRGHVVELERSTISTPSPDAHASSLVGNSVGEWKPQVQLYAVNGFCQSKPGAP